MTFIFFTATENCDILCKVHGKGWDRLVSAFSILPVRDWWMRLFVSPRVQEPSRRTLFRSQFTCWGVTVPSYLPSAPVAFKANTAIYCHPLLIGRHRGHADLFQCFINSMAPQFVPLSHRINLFPSQIFSETCENWTCHFHLLEKSDHDLWSWSFLLSPMEGPFLIPTKWFQCLQSHLHKGEYVIW